MTDENEAEMSSPLGDDVPITAQVIIDEFRKFRTESVDRANTEAQAVADARNSAAIAMKESQTAQQGAQEAATFAAQSATHANQAQVNSADVNNMKVQIQQDVDKLKNISGTQAAIAIIDKHATQLAAQNVFLAGLSQNTTAGPDKSKSKHQVKMPQMTKSYCTAQEFFRFERQARTCARVSKWDEQEEMDNVFGNLLGQASDNIKAMPVKLSEYKSITLFYKQLRLKFVDSAYQARAREQYSVAVQTHKESLRNFHIRLYSLWFDALAQEEEPWCFDPKINCPKEHNREQPGSKSKSLISAFLNGLRDPDVKDKIREIKDESGFDSYEDILQKAVLRESHVQLRRKDRLITQNRDRLQEMYADRRFEPKPHYQGQHQPHYAQQRNHMDVGMLSRRSPHKKSGPNSRKGKGPSRRTYSVAANPEAGASHTVSNPQGHTGPAYAVTNPTQIFKSQGNKYCTIHKTNSHDTSQCRARSANATQSKNVHWAPKLVKGRDKSKDKCHVCQKSGHWARECPEKRKGNVNFVGNQEYDRWSMSKEN